MPKVNVIVPVYYAEKYLHEYEGNIFNQILQ